MARRGVPPDEVAALALALPEVTEGRRYGQRTWFVAGRAFAWERPFSAADRRRSGDDPLPAGPILAVRTDGLEEKEQVLAARPGCCFTIPHFDGHPAVLVRLEAAGRRAVAELLEDAWSAVAPPRLTGPPA